MSSPSPNEADRVNVPDDRGLRRNMLDWRPSRRTLLVLGVAFAVGLLLFVLLWWRNRGQDFYRVDAVAPATSGQQFEPLPTPLPADAGDRGTTLGQPPDDTAAPDMGRIEPPPPPRPTEPARPPSPPANAAPASASVPVAISSPAPGYPPDAFRNGESGTVVVRVHVGPDGVPYSVDLVQSSHSRSLDRAASDAVRRWRFRPALRDGQPVPGVVQVPIEFTADR